MAEPYRLEAVLMLRQRAEDEAKEHLAMKLRALKVETDELKARHDALEKHRQFRQQWMQEQIEEARKGSVGAQVMRTSRYDERLRDEELDLLARIPPQEERVAAAEKEAEEARILLIEAQKQRKAIEQHKDKWKLELKKAREAREEMALDEIAQTIHDRVRKG